MSTMVDSVFCGRSAGDSALFLLGPMSFYVGVGPDSFFFNFSGLSGSGPILLERTRNAPKVPRKGFYKI